MTQITNSTCTFKEGDIVVVTDFMHTYDTYEGRAKLLELDNWINSDTPTNGREYIVVREQGITEIIAIEDLTCQQQFLINIKGVKHAETQI